VVDLLAVSCLSLAELIEDKAEVVDDILVKVVLLVQAHEYLLRVATQVNQGN